jgi:predicted DNA-binding transcriptional regulator AlpA
MVFTAHIPGGELESSPVGLYKVADILVKARFSKSHLYNLMANGHFPQPCLRYGPRFTRWSAAEVDSWLADPQSWINSRASVKGGVSA